MIREFLATFFVFPVCRVLFLIGIIAIPCPVRVNEQVVARSRIPSVCSYFSPLGDLFESPRPLFLSQVGGFCLKAGKNSLSSFLTRSSSILAILFSYL